MTRSVSTGTADFNFRHRHLQRSCDRSCLKTVFNRPVTFKKLLFPVIWINDVTKGKLKLILVLKDLWLVFYKAAGLYNKIPIVRTSKEKRKFRREIVANIQRSSIEAKQKLFRKVGSVEKPRTREIEIVQQILYCQYKLTVACEMKQVKITLIFMRKQSKGVGITKIFRSLDFIIIILPWIH